MRLDRVELNRDNFSSQLTRKLIGERTFSDLALSTQSNNNILVTIFNGGLKFAGFLLKSAFSFISWSFTGLWEALVESGYEIVNTDWNRSDEEIQKEIEQNNQLLVRQFGQLVGSGTVWFTSIAVSSALTVKFPVLAGRVALALADEANSTLRGQLVSTLQLSTQTVIRSLLLGSYLWIRKLTKGKQKTSGKPWILAEKIDNKIQSIPNPTVRNFTAGFLDGAFDSLIDIGYVVAFTLDDYYEAQRRAVESQNEPIRRVEVFPDRQSEESIILQDSQEHLEASVNNYIANQSLVANRDIGAIVGEPYQDWYSRQPQGRRLTLRFNGKQTPPFRQDGKRTQRVQVAIPDPKVGISWSDLKTIRPFIWGDHVARGVFDNRREMWTRGASEAEAVETLQFLASFSRLQLIQITTSTKKLQNPNRKKKATKVYPTHAVMMIRKATTANTNSVTIDGQNLASAQEVIEIWRDDPPQGFNGFL